MKKTLLRGLKPAAASLMAGILLLSIGGCVSTTGIKQAQADIWADHRFSQSEVATLTGDELFRLSPDLIQRLNQHRRLDASIQERADRLLQLLYTDEQRPYLYEGYHTTKASVTWEKNRGDCLSLSILAYAIGKHLNLPISIQEVPMPVQFDRQGRVEFVNGHVNAIILNPQLTLSNSTGTSERGYMLIDFDPNQFSQRRGKILTDHEVLAHFFNNLGVEAMVGNKYHDAYAYFKAAAHNAPLITATYTNLSELYRRTGQEDKAVATLEYALQLDKDSLLNLKSIERLFRHSGRLQDAARIVTHIEAIQEQDPYYWIGRGLFELENKNYNKAVTYLERAQSVTNGFEEVHQALAVAYFQKKELGKAKQQLALLAEINTNNPKLRYLKSHLVAN